MTQTTYTYPPQQGYQHASPQAFIAVKRNRVKIHPKGNENIAYLQNGIEFQIEFNNPSGYTQKAVIWINGKQQGYALVLKPGEHFYLDRFLDNEQKLKFDVYDVDNTPEVKDIIANNGLVEIRFYKEYIPQPVIIYNNSWGTSTSNYKGIYDSGNFVGTPRSSEIKTKGSSTTRNYLYSSQTLTAGAVNESYTSEEPMAEMSLDESKIETGRVAQGNKSNQSFYEVNQSFEWYCNTTVKYRILPMSQKPHEIQTNEFRSYCPSCGRRIKKGWVHCAGCGEKI
jgi:hypothetical protein